METKFKSFHFQEINWYLNIPAEGNKGKYADYTVVFVDGKSEGAEKRLKLGEVMSRPEVEEHYPHTVGYFKVLWGDTANCQSGYLELREIHSPEEFWAFLNAVNL